MSQGFAKLKNPSKPPELKVFGASLNNLKNLSCTLPHEKIVVISGPSGAGKSSLVFKTIFKKLKAGVNSWGVFPTSFIDNSQISGFRYALGVPDSGASDSEITLREFFDIEGEIEELFQKYSTKSCSFCAQEFKEESLDSMLTEVGSLEGKYDLVLKCSKVNLTQDWFFKNGLLRFIDNGEVYLAEELSAEASSFIYPIIERFELPSSKKDLLNTLSNIETSICSEGKIYLYSLEKNKIACELNLPGFCKNCGKRVNIENSLSDSNVKLFSLGYEDLCNSSFEFLLSNIKSLNLKNSEFFSFLNKFKLLGLSHLSLNRKLLSLSSGEIVRSRILKSSSRSPSKIAFFLEHPFARLHPKDKLALWQYLVSLNKSQNSLFIIEQCSKIKEAADFLLELGPCSGKDGGQVVLEKTQKAVEYKPSSLPKTKKLINTNNFLKFSGLEKNNLKKADISFPLGKLTVLSGVSGSGKTSVLKEVLAPFLKELFKDKKSKVDLNKFFLSKVQVEKSLTGSVFIDTLQPLLKPNSVVCTALSIFPEIKNYYLKTEAAKIKGLSPKDFSFYKASASCGRCEGLGEIENAFFEYEKCEICLGYRYNESLDSIIWRGVSIKDILQFSLGEALDFFKFNPKISKVLKSAVRLNLAHLKLSQASKSLSFGEKTRLLLSKELLRGLGIRNPKIFLLDEPATGLADKEVSSLIDYLKEVCSFGHTVFLIEHNTAFLNEADYLIEMGPGGGELGGEVVREGWLSS